MSDSQFAKVFAGMIGALVVLAIVLFVIANSIGSATSVSSTSGDAATVAERIKPVGAVTVASQAPATATAKIVDTLIPVASADTAKGKAVYDQSCFACHGTGVAGAPKLGDKAAWTDRVAQGNDTLYKHAIEGFQGKSGVMPPKGGAMHLSDEDVKAAVDYMVEQAG